MFVRRGGYSVEFRNERYGPWEGTAPGNAPGKTTNGWEYIGNYHIQKDDMCDGVALFSLPPPEQDFWIDHWARHDAWGQKALGVSWTADELRAWFEGPDFLDNPPRVAMERLVFDTYDEQLYADLKATQDARVRRMAAA
mmetsp:Transcript_3156/g.9240  ORF Transcript_3156/g.9240 Transcript_3156/m.9240 type:complete len:139 (-) Transcript_3156:911-1327(-)